MGISNQDMKFFCALIFGTLVVLINTLPFIFRIINKTKEARESDDFNLFMVMFNSYFYLLMIVVATCTLVFIIDTMDKMRYLNLLGGGGAFDTFWNTGIDSSTTFSASATFLIKFVRNAYEWLCLISSILLIILGFKGGYNFQKKLATKNGQDVDWMSYFAGVVGIFLAIILLKCYSYITQFSLYISGNREIIEVIKTTFSTAMGV